MTDSRAPSREFHVVGPEVAGGLGPKTVVDRSAVPPRVQNLHYVVESWLGDPILESYPVFLVTRALGEQLTTRGLTGFELRDVKVTRSEQLDEFEPHLRLPDFRWLFLTGNPTRDDFAQDGEARLVISDRALETLREGGMRHAEVTPI